MAPLKPRAAEPVSERLDRLLGLLASHEGWKIARTFPPEERARVTRVRRRILHGPPASAHIHASLGTPRPAALGPIQQGFFEQRALEIQYGTAREQTTRRVEPHYLMLSWPVWYLLAWDHRRVAIRTLRLDRVEAARVTDRSFKLRDVDEMMVVARDLFAPV